MQKETTQLYLEALLIMPVQRVPRYILLLQDMLKYTSESHDDHESLKQALAFIKVKMAEINKSIDNTELEHCKKLIHIEQTLDGDFETFVQPGRRYIREGNLYHKEIFNSFALGNDFSRFLKQMS